MGVPGHDAVNGYAGMTLHALVHLGGAALSQQLLISTGFWADQRAYSRSWLTKLDDKRAAIWEAAKQASGAAEWLREALVPTDMQLAA
ncbi:MAG: hypothetical protein K0U64_02580 [Actinomycetia bacterium]|nr:hypothetical protein [Actinomycetes bacterium]